ncbi:hypothetical protein RHMOL_Rhmol08G0008700 [Rhododendron molle]|uniref:Uncharacterized protein n=1 Tax=Rhododendron molle TaxID=49168 RepID=A0ACC0MI77_RHOML|nr:hypothetical protein RHMOL_Rhmol08G0008700 [Rhododendron molle]
MSIAASLSASLSTPTAHPTFEFHQNCVARKWRTRASSAAPGVDLTTLESAIAKKDSDAVKEALDQLTEVGWAKKWSSQPYVSRRMTSLRELTTLGIKNAENLAIPSVRNDAAFLFTVVGTTGFVGVLAGQLPGDWGFFVPYLVGSISLVVLAVGSISPGLLQAAIGGFASFFPDYQERISRHEAAHFLGNFAYVAGSPLSNLQKCSCLNERITYEIHLKSYKRRYICPDLPGVGCCEDATYPHKSGHLATYVGLHTHVRYKEKNSRASLSISLHLHWFCGYLASTVPTFSKKKEETDVMILPMVNHDPLTKCWLSVYSPCLLVPLRDMSRVIVSTQTPVNPMWMMDLPFQFHCMHTVCIFVFSPIWEAFFDETGPVISVAYLLGLPILGYSLDIGKEHVNLIDEKLEKLIYSGQLDAKELDRLAVVAMAGLAAEGLQYDKVVGQSADLFTLQRLINRSKPQISKEQQQNLTRWAVLFAASVLKNNKVIHETLMSAMARKATVLECIDAIEKAA